MFLWLVLVVMTAVAAFAVLWSLSRGAVSRSGSEIEIYEDQLAEIERDRRAGRLLEPEAAAARLEVSRRLLAADAASPADGPEPSLLHSQRRRRIVAFVALALLPAAAFALYWTIGSPSIPGEPLAARLAAPPEQRSVATLLAQVEAHLARNPEDGRGWEVLAPVYLRLGRFDDAVKARRASLRLLGANADREADLGEALVAGSGGVVTAEAKGAFERAVVLDPAEPKARFFLGLAAEQDGKPVDAARIWRGILAEAPPNAPWTEFIRQALARIEPVAKRLAPGPDAEDLAAAEQLTPEQRAEMVRGMVERLAERLKRDASDFEGWLRLVRAYSVLGEHEKAQSAAADARRVLGDDAGKARRLDDLVRDLGLKG